MEDEQHPSGTAAEPEERHSSSKEGMPSHAWHSIRWCSSMEIAVLPPRWSHQAATPRSQVWWVRSGPFSCFETQQMQLSAQKTTIQHHYRSLQGRTSGKPQNSCSTSITLSLIILYGGSQYSMSHFSLNYHKYCKTFIINIPHELLSSVLNKCHNWTNCVFFSLCPFPYESADVYQISCQSVQPFGRFSRLLHFWPPKTPHNSPWVSRG